ncbi:MAG: hypothetical protein K0S86_1981 [Geminicoccaceae bacterium]|nr:hypothetical protein [Geminicoccaceae bacterium]
MEGTRTAGRHSPMRAVPLIRDPGERARPGRGQIPSIPLIPSSVSPLVLDAGGYDLARRGVSAEPSSGRFGPFRVIVVPTGPARAEPYAREPSSAALPAFASAA